MKLLFLLFSLALLFASVVVAIPSVSGSSENCHITASKAYVAAILKKTKKAADAVPLHEDVDRVEGPPGLYATTASNAQQLRASFLTGPSAIFVTGLDPNKPDPAYAAVNATTVRADYYLLAGLDAKLAEVNLVSTRVEEFFSFDDAHDCKLQHIFATFYI